MTFEQVPLVPCMHCGYLMFGGIAHRECVSQAQAEKLREGLARICPTCRSQGHRESARFCSVDGAMLATGGSHAPDPWYRCPKCGRRDNWPALYCDLDGAKLEEERK